MSDLVSPTALDLFSWRTAAGLTQKAAAIAIGAPLASYRNWEQGRTPIPAMVGIVLVYIRRHGILQTHDIDNYLVTRAAQNGAHQT